MMSQQGTTGFAYRPPVAAAASAIVALALASAGCAHTYDYDYEERGPEPQASSYEVPAEDPKGTVYVVSLGPENVPSGDGQTSPHMHLRLAVENQTDTVAWTIDARDQLLSFGRADQAAPAFASSGPQGEGPALITVAPGDRGEMDLWYSLPASGEPDRVTFDWQIDRGGALVAEQTVFERQVAPETDYAYYEPAYHSRVSVGVGLGWWWGPYAPYWSVWNPWWGYYPYGYWGYYPGYWWGPRNYYGYGYRRPYGYYDGGGAPRRSVRAAPSRGSVRAAPSRGGVRAAPSRGGGVRSAPSGGGRSVRARPSR